METTTETSALTASAGAPPEPSNALVKGRAPGLITLPQYDNEQRVIEIFQEDRRACFDSRWVFERQWWRNILYDMNRQWIYFDRRKGVWLDKRMHRWMPRPVTNKLAEGRGAIQAVLAAITLSTLARPVGGKLQNVAAAEIADDMQPLIHQEHGMSQVLRDQDYWLIVTGNAFLLPEWDLDESFGSITIPHEQCTACGNFWPPSKLTGPQAKCPSCGNTAFLKDPVGPDGAPIGDTYPVGRGRTSALSPLEVAFPPIYRDFDASHTSIQMSWHPRQYWEEHYPDAAKTMEFGKTPTERSMQLMRTMATATDTSTLPAAFGFSGGQELEAEGATKYTLRRKPTKEFPQGLFGEFVGEGAGTIALRDRVDTPGQPLPYTTRDGRPMVNLIHVRYDPIGGRSMSRGPYDYCIQKQDMVNQIDANMQLAAQRMSNPIWLKPKGQEVSSFTGEPGLVVSYNPLVATNAKPERIPGEPVNPSLMQLRQQYIDDIEHAMGTSDVLKGIRPAGVEAFSALQLLVERSQSRLSIVFAERGAAYRKWYAMALEMQRQFGPTERVMAVISPNGGWTFQHFMNAKLDGEVEIVVEDGTMTPKTNLGKRAALEHGAQLGAIDMADPEQKYVTLKELGLTEWVSTLDGEIKSAKQEQDQFEQWAASGEAEAAMPQIEMALAQFQQQQMMYQQQQQAAQQIGAMTGVPPALAPPPTLPPMTPFVRKVYHNDAVHVSEHRKWATGDTAQELFKANPLLEQLFMLHLQEHMDAVQQQQMAMVGATAAARGGGGGAMAGSNRESGSPGDVPKGNKQSAQGRGPE